MGDLRLGERWSKLQKAKNDALWAAARALLAVARLVPPSRLRVWGRAVGALAFVLARGPRRIADANVARVFPDWGEGRRRSLVRANFRQLGEILGEIAILLTERPLPPLSFEPAAEAVLDAMVAEGRGVLLVSAHLGNWERVAHALVARGTPLTTIARESYDPRFLPWYARVRGAVEVIYRGSAGASTRIVRVLRRGRVLGIPMDLRSRVPSTEVPFLGHPAPTPVGPRSACVANRGAGGGGDTRPYVRTALHYRHRHRYHRPRLGPRSGADSDGAIEPRALGENHAAPRGLAMAPRAVVTRERQDGYYPRKRTS